MRIIIAIWLFTLVATTIFPQSEASSLWDHLPLISQGKSAILFIIGKDDEAKETWENFKNMTLLWDNVKELDTAIPVWGHGKGVYFLIKGDKEAGLDAIESATKTLVVIGAGVVTGPGGALAGSVGTDAAFSALRQKPRGVVEYIYNINKKNASEHIDMALDIGSLVLLTPKVKNNKPVLKKKYTKNGEETVSLLEEENVAYKGGMKEMIAMRKNPSFADSSASGIDGLTDEWFRSVLQELQIKLGTSGFISEMKKLTESMNIEFVIKKVIEKPLGGPYTPREIYFLKNMNKDAYRRNYADVPGISVAERATEVLNNLDFIEGIISKKRAGLSITPEEMKFFKDIGIDLAESTSEEISGLAEAVEKMREASLVEFQPPKLVMNKFNFKEFYAMRIAVGKRIEIIKAEMRRGEFVGGEGIVKVGIERYSLEELKALREQINKMIPEHHDGLVGEIPNYPNEELEFMLDTLVEDYNLKPKNDADLERARKLKKTE